MADSFPNQTAIAFGFPGGQVEIVTNLDIATVKSQIDKALKEKEYVTFQNIRLKHPTVKEEFTIFDPSKTTFISIAALHGTSVLLPGKIQ